MLSFRLSQSFIEGTKKYANPFKNNTLGEIVYLRTYSRNNETWAETVKRVVEGSYSIQKDYMLKNRLGWDNEKAQESAQEMYNRMYNMKFLPPGRGLWAMGTDIVHQKGLAMALNNCAFVSTKDIDKDPTKPFEFIMDVSMLGTGCGFDTRGANHKLKIHTPIPTDEKEYLIPDTREGWVSSIRLLLDSYFKPNKKSIEFDYSLIRKSGTKIKTFGGTSSGAGPLIDLHLDLRRILNNNTVFTSRVITDICNLIAKCVISGNIRRSALIAFGEPNDKEFIELKDYEKNPERSAYGWTSNNSIFAKDYMNYKPIEEQINKMGEPGLLWLDRVKNYGRMSDAPNNKDYRALGANPCNEQSLESFEVCCLVETFPTNHDTVNDFLTTLKYAYLYAKSVTLLYTHHTETNKIIARNRRIGTSVSGIAQFIDNNSKDSLKGWLCLGYVTIQNWDTKYSELFGIPKSIKTTSVKPSGTVSLLAGVTPGVHYPESRYYIRRVRIANDSPLINKLKGMGYKVEPCVNTSSTTSVIEFPIDMGNVKSIEDVSMEEQVELAVFMQRYWSDNQVSCTVTFNPKTEGRMIASVLQKYEQGLKGISFLPKLSYDRYPQMPYEKIDKHTYDEMVKKISNFQNLISIKEEITVKEYHTFCDGDMCDIPTLKSV